MTPLARRSRTTRAARATLATLSALTLIALAGCGGANQADDTSTSQSPASENTASESTASESTVVGAPTSGSPTTVASDGGSPGTDSPEPMAPTEVPDILRFTAPVIGGGDLDVGQTYAGDPVAFWFWAPG
jgi:hypothetical protein